MAVSLSHSEKLVSGVILVFLLSGNEDRGISDLYIYQAFSTQYSLSRLTRHNNVQYIQASDVLVGWWQ